VQDIKDINKIIINSKQIDKGKTLSIIFCVYKYERMIIMNKDKYIEKLKEAIQCQTAKIHIYEKFITDDIKGTIKKTISSSLGYEDDNFKKIYNIQIPPFQFAISEDTDFLNEINRMIPKYNLEKGINQRKIVSGLELLKMIRNNEIDKGTQFFKESNGCCGNLCEFNGLNLVNKENHDRIISLAEFAISKFHFKEMKDDDDWILGTELLKEIEYIEDGTIFSRFNIITGEHSIVKFNSESYNVSNMIDCEYRLVEPLSLTAVMLKYSNFKGKYKFIRKIEKDSKWIEIKSKKVLEDLCEKEMNSFVESIKEWELK